MSHISDDVARILATPMPRRQTFKLLGGVLAGGVLGSLGMRRAFAQGCNPACKSNQICCGTKCIPNNQICCNGNGIPNNQTCCNGKGIPNNQTCCNGTGIPNNQTCCHGQGCPPNKTCCNTAQDTKGTKFCITPPKTCSNTPSPGG